MLTSQSVGSNNKERKEIDWKEKGKKNKKRKKKRKKKKVFLNGLLGEIGRGGGAQMYAR